MGKKQSLIGEFHPDLLKVAKYKKNNWLCSYIILDSGQI